MQERSGQKAEVSARNFLEHHGLKHITSNFSCKRGEIDLVMLHSKVLVFVEVRQRKLSRYATAIQTIDGRKRSKIILAAQFFLRANARWRSHPCRFDVVTYDGDPAQCLPRWLKGAFE